MKALSTVPTMGCFTVSLSGGRTHVPGMSSWPHRHWSQARPCPVRTYCPGPQPRARGQGPPEHLPKCSPSSVCTAFRSDAQSLCMYLPPAHNTGPGGPAPRKPPLLLQSWQTPAGDGAGRMQARLPAARRLQVQWPDKSGPALVKWKGHLGEVGQQVRGCSWRKVGCGAVDSLTFPSEISVDSSLGGMVMVVADSGREGASDVKNGQAGRGQLCPDPPVIQ